LHPLGTPKPSKNAFLLQQNWFLDGFDVPGGCKSILNVKCLHKSHMAELFGPRVFCFPVGQKKKFGNSLLAIFDPTLKKILIYEKSSIFDKKYDDKKIKSFG